MSKRLEISQADLKAAFALLGGDLDRYDETVAMRCEAGLVTITYVRTDETGSVCMADAHGRPLHETVEFNVRSVLDERGVVQRPEP